jgi:hypothetical protein
MAGCLSNSRPLMSNPLSLAWRGEIPVEDAATQTQHWAHHGLAVLPDGHLVTADPAGRTILILDELGTCQQRIPAPVTQAHGITVEQSGTDTWIWIADNGDHLVIDQSSGLVSARNTNPSGQVLKMSLDGEVLLRLEAPALAAYTSHPYSPTHVVIDSTADGGFGNVWVCDGYGSALVLVYNAEGALLDVLDGTNGLGRFDQPHGAFVDRRHGRPELLVADRGNSRIQVFTLDGTFLRGIGVGDFLTPGHFASFGSEVLVSELHKRIMGIDVDDRVYVALDSSDGAVGEFDSPWPHAPGHRAGVMRPAVQPGRLNSPHSIAVSGDLLLVAEWILGGRICAFTIRECEA